jgi:hypothetical protein
MAVTATPIFLQTVRSETIQNPATANTNRDGSTGTYSSAFTAGANGSLIDAIVFTAPGTTTAGLVRIFYAADGITYRLIAEVVVTAVTPSGTVAAYTTTWTPPTGQPFGMKASSTLRFNMNNAELMNCTVNGGDY